MRNPTARGSGGEVWSIVRNVRPETERAQGIHQEAAAP